MSDLKPTQSAPPLDTHPSHSLGSITPGGGGSGTGASTPTPAGTGTPYRRRRAQEFQLPDGKRILVALPEEAAALRDKYARRGDDGHGAQIEVVVHGSAEHTGYLRQSAHHHAARREALRQRFPGDFDEWERVAGELDRVTAQLDRLADHSESLGHNFSKFGYSAHLRTYGEDEGGSGGGRSGANSSRASVSSQGGLGEGGGGGSWDDRSAGTTMKLFRRPVIKQYFHRGLLWRASEETAVMSFELFFDLLYVGIIAINGDHVSEDADGRELLRFVITFGMSWKIWTDLSQYIAWFESNDVLQRVEFLFLISCLLGLTTNMLQTFDEEHDTYVYLVAFYLAARLFTAAYCGLTALLLPLIKGMMISQIICILIPAALWIGSMQVETMEQRIPLMFVALALDIFGSMAIVALFRYSRVNVNKAGSSLARFFEFYPAINIEHKVERTSAFVCLVLGYSVVGVIYQNTGFPVNAFLGKAVLGLVQAFIFNWIYFDVDGCNIHVHAIRRHVISASLWQYAHLLFIMSYILSAAALSRLVLAHDCADAPVDSLTHLYEERSQETVELGLRLFYGAGLGVALFSTVLISVSHTHKLPRTCRLPKPARLANRTLVACVLCALPAVGGLSSLRLVGTTVGLVAWVLLVEVWGKSCDKEAFWGGGRADCRYTARCSKKQLDEALGRFRDGGDVDVNVLGNWEKHGADVLE